jgi:acetyl-CoA carboxylase carboxyltransferase component
MDVNGKNFKKFLERQQLYESQYDADSRKKQHSKGKLTARERIAILFDTDTFEEVDAFVTPAKGEGEFGKIASSYGDG